DPHHQPVIHGKLPKHIHSRVHRAEEASSRHICDLLGLSVSVRELNPETSSDLRSGAEFRGHWQIEFPPCFEASFQNPYVCDSLATQQDGCAGAGNLIS